MSEHPNQRWRWTMRGTLPSSGTLARGCEETGEIDAERAGEAVEHVVQRGPWDLFDQDERVTITIEPIAVPVDAGERR